MFFPKKNLDVLSRPARLFYERANFKLALSFFIAAFGMALLGLSSIYGGLASKNQNTSQNECTDDCDRYKDLSSGYGFACAMFLFASFLTIGASVYISPYLGSINESTILKSPQELEPYRSSNYSKSIDNINKI